MKTVRSFSGITHYALRFSAALVLMAVCLFIGTTGCGPSPTQPEVPYQLFVYTYNDLYVFPPGHSIYFVIRLTRGTEPVAGEYVNVRYFNSQHAYLGYTLDTDSLGYTNYIIRPEESGQYAIGFVSPDGKEFVNCVIFVKEDSVDNSFRVFENPNPPMLTFGFNQSETKETLGQKAKEVALRTITDVISNPIYQDSGLFCLSGISAEPDDGGFNSTLIAVTCPTYYNSFMGVLIKEITRHAIDKFVDDPVQKESGLRAVQSMELAQTVITYSDIVISSPTNGLSLPAYLIENYQGATTAQRALTHVFDAQQLVDSTGEGTAQLAFVNDSAFVMTMYLRESNYLHSYDRSRVVTIGLGKILQPTSTAHLVRQ